MLLYSFALFYFEFEGNFQVQAPEGLYSEGRFNGGILGYEFRGLTHGGAYFRNFKVFNLYNQLRILQTFTEKDTNNLHNSSRIKSGFLEDRA